MSYYDVVIQPDGRPALVLRIEPPRPPKNTENREVPSEERGVVIIDPYEDSRQEVVILEM